MIDRCHFCPVSTIFDAESAYLLVITLTITLILALTLTLNRFQMVLTGFNWIKPV